MPEPPARTLLHQAAQGGRGSCIPLLIEHGANVNCIDEMGMTPLHHASEDAIHRLVEHGADVNATSLNGMTPLHCATQNGNLDTIQLLIDHGANVNAKDEIGMTPLNYAIYHDFSDTLELRRMTIEVIRGGGIQRDSLRPEAPSLKGSNTLSTFHCIHCGHGLTWKGKVVPAAKTSLAHKLNLERFSFIVIVYSPKAITYPSNTPGLPRVHS
ncbi:ankyrin repeat-containing protein, putative [Talaromyces stipitatus ATCC 10500]|uniref:Ankyrin repeat-containing protein, putative n=1 Tax=Talaromyces stipitatus (strain ATCC 10500 / CBS 375.48 / QM 6759 / NRRL 1006) TaxID=441959 RepID=B8LX46_TALSN|nr:ankyrin repeat-containing protein, putative [Talaromyces stipitatus ATCC 10500]EED22696.1 ankyrin repeat-containing protein, putative [Talaromyces stipitatus ATCC 10500]